MNEKQTRTGAGETRQGKEEDTHPTGKGREKRASKRYTRKTLAPEIRFRNRYIINPQTECWEWFGFTNDQGYGLFSPLGRRRKFSRAHRWSYEYFIGPIPDGLHVCHHCDNPKCVNPDHLFVGTRSDNAMDRERKGRGNTFQRDKTHCPQGHPYNDENTFRYKNGHRECRQCKNARRKLAQKLRKKKLNE